MRVHVQNGESERKKEGIPRSPISEQKYRLHPLGQLKRPIADLPDRGEGRINQKCSALQEDVQNGQTFKEQKAPNVHISPELAGRPRSEAYSWKLAQVKGHREPSSLAASTIDQADDKLGRLPHPLVIKRTPVIILSLVLSYVVPWLGIFLMVPLYATRSRVCDC